MYFRPVRLFAELGGTAPAASAAGVGVPCAAPTYTFVPCYHLVTSFETSNASEWVQFTLCNSGSDRFPAFQNASRFLLNNQYRSGDSLALIAVAAIAAWPAATLTCESPCTISPAAYRPAIVVC